MKSAFQGLIVLRRRGVKVFLIGFAQFLERVTRTFLHCLPMHPQGLPLFGSIALARMCKMRQGELLRRAVPLIEAKAKVSAGLSDFDSDLMKLKPLQRSEELNCDCENLKPCPQTAVRHAASLGICVCIIRQLSPSTLQALQEAA